IENQTGNIVQRFTKVDLLTDAEGPIQESKFFVGSVEFTPEYAAVVLKTGKIKRWKLGDPKKSFEMIDTGLNLDGYNGVVRSSNSNTLALLSKSDDGSIISINLNDPKGSVRRLTPPRKQGNPADLLRLPKLSPDGKTLAALYRYRV